MTVHPAIDDVPCYIRSYDRGREESSGVRFRDKTQRPITIKCRIDTFLVLLLHQLLLLLLLRRCLFFFFPTSTSYKDRLTPRWRSKGNICLLLVAINDDKVERERFTCKTGEYWIFCIFLVLIEWGGGGGGGWCVQYEITFRLLLSSNAILWNIVNYWNTNTVCSCSILQRWRIEWYIVAAGNLK